MTVTDPNGHATTLGYRAFGNPDVKQLMSVVQPNGVATTATRTVAGQITAITQGSITRGYTYDAHHFLQSQTDPEVGTTTYTHDAVGNVMSKQVGSQKTTTNTYDADNHLLTTGYNDTQDKGQTITRAYDADGHLVTVKNSASASQWTYSYDANGNLLNQLLTVDKQHVGFATTFDGYDHVATRTFADGTGLAYSVTPMGHIKTITQTTGSKTPFITNVTYFPDNHIQSFTSGNGVVTTYTENSRDMRNSVVAKGGNTTFVDKQYTYDGVGNILSITDNLKSANSQSMAYDGLNRLTDVKGVWGDMQLSYDVNSNITAKQIGTALSTYAYNAKDQLSAITGSHAQPFGYANGDMTKMGGLHLDYNTLQQVGSITGTGVNGVSVNDSNGYDGNGNRVLATKNGQTHIEAYNQKDQLLYKNNPATGVQDAYIRLGGHTVVHLKTKAGVATPIYLHDNLLGSTLVATSQNGQTKWTENYKPYGDELIKNKDRDNPHVGYTGKPHDDDTGLSYYGARYYSPSIGRFISPDPHPVDIKMPISFNRYAYANDNPYRYKDKDGKLPDLVEQAVGTVLGGFGGWEASKGASFGQRAKAASIGAGAGFAASFASAALSEAAGAVGGGLIARASGYVAAGTAVRAVGNQISTGKPNITSSFFQSLGAGGVRSINTWGQSLGDVPLSGKAIIGGHITLGEAAVEGIIHNTTETHGETNHVTNASVSVSHGNTNSTGHSGDHSDNDGGDHDH